MDKLTHLETTLRGMGSVVVAYSGGVDSTFLAATAHRVLGELALAVTAASPTYPPREVAEAEALAARLGMRHLVIETREGDNPAFVANSPRRCYFCKTELFRKLQEVARAHGLAWVADGTNTDDLADHRPGRDAARELGVRSPLVEAELTKAEIREMSRSQGLPTWDKPALACLASRFPYGTPIAEDVLDRIARGEDFLRGLGVRQVRLRHHGDTARIEVGPEDIPLLTSEEVRGQLVSRLRSLGWVYITLDLAGYRSGSMNEVLKG